MQAKFAPGRPNFYLAVSVSLVDMGEAKNGASRILPGSQVGCRGARAKNTSALHRGEGKQTQCTVHSQEDTQSEPG